MKVTDRIRERLAQLPDKPGVYVMRDRAGAVIYVGKARSLRRRVQSYFRAGTLRRGDPKLLSLVHSVHDLEVMPLRTEAEATIVEGQFIKDFRPRYNVAFKDDKRFLLLRVDPAEPFPRFALCRLRRDDGARWFGPYASAAVARAAHEFLDKHFGLRRCRPRVPGAKDHRHCIDDVVRFCSAPCILRVTAEQYRARVDAACAFLRGESPEVLKDLRGEMLRASAELNFERAAALRDWLGLLHRAVRQRAIAARSLDTRAAASRTGVEALGAALGLPAPPRVIECYDISNIGGTLAVGSLVCAVDGVPRRARYRLFRIRTVEGSDDPAMMAEVLRRRFGRAGEAGWGPPDMVLVDGGLPQLRAARAVLRELGLAALPTAGLAKTFEEIHWGPEDAERVLSLPLDSPALTVLRALRDEAHRFAVTYHRRLRARRIRESALDEIEGVGPSRKAALLRRFGSVLRLRRAPVDAIAAVPGVGPALAARIAAALAAGADDEPSPPAARNAEPGTATPGTRAPPEPGRAGLKPRPGTGIVSRRENGVTR